jgi:phosphate transport system permease protein
MVKSEQNAFQRKIDWANRRARSVITIGGYSIIVSIVGILLFLIFQSLPLTFKTSIKNLLTVELPAGLNTIMLVGIDQYQEISYFLNASGKIDYYQVIDHNFINQDSIPLRVGEKIISASKGSLNKEIFALGTNRGQIITAEIRMFPQYADNQRFIETSLRIIDTFKVNLPEQMELDPIEKIAFCQNEDGNLYWSWLDHLGHLHLKIKLVEEEISYDYLLTDYLGKENVSTFTVSFDGEKLIVGSQTGELFWFDLGDEEEIYLRQNWKSSQSAITALAFLIGDNSLVIGDQNGMVEVWFPVRDDNNQFRFLPIHQFDPLPEAVTYILGSPRDRTFLVVDQTGRIQLNYSTTNKTQLEFKKSEYPIQSVAFAPKADGIILLDRKHRFGLYQLKNEHPEATLESLFGKVWYEGYPQPEFVWQSTGGSDEFESKFSLIPLIFGTLKGTLYAMIFSMPLAILAAIYVSQFSPKWLARIIKPTVEIMAALPSVVIGFLAGLYFSPLFEKHLMALVLSALFLPIFFLVSIFIWRLVPEARRIRMPLGWELLYIIPMLTFTIISVMLLADPIEFGLFAGNFKQWLFEVLGQSYDQRNSIVVGFALGFAVIPIIFTISEDALSNVPASLTSAALALGASRWQTVRRVVVPAAASGIFAAVMLGFGRAIGETMIVLMATGNTPILDLSPFNGFRAMSACIAVEIPEAPVGDTLYRVLFLIAFLLFIFTFIINSISAVISDRLRRKYARF